MNDSPTAGLEGWEIRPNVSQQSLYHLLECVMEIAYAIQGLGHRSRDQTEEQVFVSNPLMVSTTRGISTSIRKILLDGNGSLLKRCVVDPNIHPLKHPDYRPPMSFVRPFQEQSWNFGWADGRSSDITVPAFDHTTVIHPLHGVRHVGGTQFSIYDPFDYSAEPVRFGRWMNAGILEIDGIRFKTEQVLRDMSNKEGAHIEENASFIVPADVSVDKDDNTLHRLANSVRFGGLTYLQNFTLFTGLYIVNRARLWIGDLPFPENNPSVAYMCETIDSSPKSIATQQAEIEFTGGPMAILDHDLKIKGDFSTGVTTTFKTP